MEEERSRQATSKLDWEWNGMDVSLAETVGCSRIAFKSAGVSPPTEAMATYRIKADLR